MRLVSLRPLLLCLVAAGLLAGCTSQQGLLRDVDSDVNRLDRPPLCGQISDLSIRDERPDVTNRQLRVPTVSFPSQEDAVSPPLTSREKSIIEEEIRTVVAAIDTASFDVDVAVLEGVQTFDAKTFTEEQGARWKIEVQLSGPGVSGRGVGEAAYAGSFLDASEDYAVVLYRRALRYSIAAAFSEAVQALPDRFSACRSASTPGAE